MPSSSAEKRDGRPWSGRRLLGSITPARRRGEEYLDRRDVPPALRLRSLADVERSNMLFGGRRAVAGEVERLFHEQLRNRRHIFLLDVGCGTGDVAAAVMEVATRHGIGVTAVGVDLAPELALAASARTRLAACADAFRLPFASSSMDLVICSQLLHHFPEPDCVRLIRELDRVARSAVVVGDLRRSWVAVGGFWLASFPLGFHDITRHDGVLSVLRGFTRDELAALVNAAVGRTAAVRGWAGWRLTASWSPNVGVVSQ